MRGICKSCGHILHLERGECHHCRDKHESGDIWLAAAIVLVVIGVLLAWFGVEALAEASIRLTTMNW